MKFKIFNSKKARSKILIGGILLAVAVLFSVGVIAQTQYPEGHEQELEQELNQLESELVSERYDRLINYSGVVDNVFYEKMKYLSINYLFIYINSEFNYETK